jgi:hypothetical protein
MDVAASIEDPLVSRYRFAMKMTAIEVGTTQRNSQNQVLKNHGF